MIRRRIHLSRAGLPDRRVRWADRRQHTGLFRILFINVFDIPRRLLGRARR